MGSRTMSIASLPSELWIQIFSYLPVPSLTAVSSASKEFSAFFGDDQNASSIWRNACLLHGVVIASRVDFNGEAHATTVTEPPRREWGRWREWNRTKNPNARHGEVRWSDVLELYSKQSLSGEEGILRGRVDWKAFLKRRLEIHRSWSGKLPSDIVHYPSDGVRFAPSASKSHLAALYLAMQLSEGIPDEESLSSPDKAKGVVEAFKTLFGLPPNEDYLAEGNRDVLKRLVSAWTKLWTKNLPKTVRRLVPSPKKVHRIKVDERNGFALTTHRDGGLVVTDIHTKEILWCLPKSHVHGNAHLEYEQGYFIFERDDGAREVWRSSSIPQTPILAPSSPPDRLQMFASALANGDNDELLRSLIRQSDSPPDIPGGLGDTLPFWKPPPLLDQGDGERAMGLLDVVFAESVLRIHDGSTTEAVEATPFGWVNLDDLRRCFKHEDCVHPTEGTTSTKGPKGGRLSPHFVPHMVIPPPRVDGEEDTTWASRYVLRTLCSPIGAYIPFQVGVSVLPGGILNPSVCLGCEDWRASPDYPSTQEFTVPTGYPSAPSARSSGDQPQGEWKGKERAMEVDAKDAEDDDANESQMEMDGSFPVFRPFKSGFFDENATYSLNSHTPSGSPSSNRHSLADPLCIHTNPPSRLGGPYYVELSERWIFVSGKEGLRLFARGRELFDQSDVLARIQRNLGYDLHPGDLALRIVSDRIHYARRSASLGKESFREHWGSELVRQQVVWDEEVELKTEDEANQVEVLPPQTHAAEDQSTTRRRLKLFDLIIAAHVSPDQKHFVAMFCSSRLLFVPNFERVIAGEDTIWNSAVDIQLGPVNVQSVYLSYGGGESGSGGSAGRISVVTEAGIFIVTPYFIKDPASQKTKVDLTVHRMAPSFMSPHNLRDISCLQMSDTGLWVNWYVPEPPKPRPPPPPAPKYDPSKNPNHPYCSGFRTSWLIENGYLPAPGQAQAAQQSTVSGTENGAGEDGDDSEEEDDEAVEPYPGDDTDSEDDEALEPYPGDDTDDGDDDEDEDDEALEPYPGDADDDEGEWEDVDSEDDEDEDARMEDEHSEDEDTDEEDESEEERDIFDEGPNAAVYPGDAYFSGRPNLREPEKLTYFQRDGKTWRKSSWYPMVAMEVTEEERIQAESSQPAQAATDSAPAKAKGKQPERQWSSMHPPHRDRSWMNQSFPQDTTPPSQFAVEGGRCKWNTADLKGPKTRRLAPLERDAHLHEIEFVIGLEKKRLTKWGTASHGVAFGSVGADLRVQTERTPRRQYKEEDRFELHQIRFVPS
ncbi:hypothetical protein NMY22_g4162 [Coprinellus aureogranulatus]|nr:hypothetical protein NMY22_g4162 [Coprinellus aureogranulatus]